jgi:hypothetical protein
MQHKKNTNKTWCSFVLVLHTGTLTCDKQPCVWSVCLCACVCAFVCMFVGVWLQTKMTEVFVCVCVVCVWPVCFHFVCMCLESQFLRAILRACIIHHTYAAIFSIYIWHTRSMIQRKPLTTQAVQLSCWSVTRTFVHTYGFQDLCRHAPEFPGGLSAHIWSHFILMWSMGDFWTSHGMDRRDDRGEGSCLLVSACMYASLDECMYERCKFLDRPWHGLPRR